LVCFYDWIDRSGRQHHQHEAGHGACVECADIRSVFFPQSKMLLLRPQLASFTLVAEWQ